ncbi:MAG TPA: HDOD domain-containing protein [Fibrobacteraceae bacterium]|nr:HDOD domain-containing protein [Fibrobacteraceae bacterium]
MTTSAVTPQSRAAHLRRISQSLLNLPTLPTFAAKLLDLVDNPRTNAAHLSQFVAQDQVITARLLKMCNSSYYGLGREISSVHQAVVILGFDMVREVSLGVSVINAFRSAKSLDGFDLSGFWDHSFAVGSAARRIAKGWLPHMSSEAFTAGLLHDIGKVLLIQYLPEDFAEILATAQRTSRNLNDVEREFLDTDHGQIGGWLAERWKLPKALADAMAYHHHLEDCPTEHRDLAAVVQLSDLLCRLLKAGQGGNPAPAVISRELYDLLWSWGMQPTIEGLKPLLTELAQEFGDLSTMRAELLN